MRALERERGKRNKRMELARNAGQVFGGQYIYGLDMEIQQFKEKITGKWKYDRNAYSSFP